MPQQLKAAGTYKGRILQHAVVASSKKGLPQYALKIGCFEVEGYLVNPDGSQQLDAGGRPVIGWSPLDDEYQVQDYMMLAYHNDQGQAEFTKTFENLQDALGWTPDPNRLWESLQEIPTENLVVQIVTETEVYDGKERTVIRFINPVGYAGAGIKAMDAPALQQLSNTWAGAFRAKFGSGTAGAAPAPAPAASPAPASPAPAQAAPASPPQAAAAAPAPVAQATAPAPVAAATPTPSTPPATPQPGGAPAAAPSSPDELWALCVQARGNMTDDALSKEYFRIIHVATGASSQAAIDALTPDQWGLCKAEFDLNGIIPF